MTAYNKRSAARQSRSTETSLYESECRACRSERNRARRAVNGRLYSLQRYVQFEGRRRMLLGALYTREEPCCEFCGVSDLPHTAYHWHHLDPEKKTKEISELLRSRTDMSTVIAEALKCLRLCANCHAVMHYITNPERTTYEAALCELREAKNDKRTARAIG